LRIGKLVIVATGIGSDTQFSSNVQRHDTRNDEPKCSLVMRDHSGVKILPPNENSLSTDALDGSPMFRVT